MIWNIPNIPGKETLWNIPNIPGKEMLLDVPNIPKTIFEEGWRFMPETGGLLSIIHAFTGLF
jgi:hypothetical protein